MRKDRQVKRWEKIARGHILPFGLKHSAVGPKNPVLEPLQEESLPQSVHKRFLSKLVNVTPYKYWPKFILVIKRVAGTSEQNDLSWKKLLLIGDQVSDRFQVLFNLVLDQLFLVSGVLS